MSHVETQCRPMLLSCENLPWEFSTLQSFVSEVDTQNRIFKVSWSRGTEYWSETVKCWSWIPVLL